MYKVSTYFTSIFSKLRISDKEVRTLITSLYKELVIAALENVPESRRIPVLKLVSQSIKDSVNYLKVMQQQGKSLDSLNTTALRSSIRLSTRLISDIGLRTSMSASADRILNEAFLSEIACDIGECIRDYSDTSNLRGRIDIVKRLCALLDDYNTVQGTALTVRGVLDKKSLDEN